MSAVSPDRVPDRGTPRRPAWLAPTSLTLAVLGLLVSAYLTVERLTSSTTLACVESATINCTKVTSSSYSAVLGVPVAVLGLLYFAALVALTLPAVWRRAPRSVDALRLAVAATGLPMVLYLVWAEFFRIGAICLWCTGVHVITFVLLVVLLVGAILTDPPATEPLRAGDRGARPGS